MAEPTKKRDMGRIGVWILESDGSDPILCPATRSPEHKDTASARKWIKDNGEDGKTYVIACIKQEITVKTETKTVRRLS